MKGTTYWLLLDFWANKGSFLQPHRISKILYGTATWLHACCCQETHMYTSAQSSSPAWLHSTSHPTPTTSCDFLYFYSSTTHSSASALLPLTLCSPRTDPYETCSQIWVAHGKPWGPTSIYGSSIMATFFLKTLPLNLCLLPCLLIGWSLSLFCVAQMQFLSLHPMSFCFYSFSPSQSLEWSIKTHVYTYRDREPFPACTAFSTFGTELPHCDFPSHCWCQL